MVDEQDEGSDFPKGKTLTGYLIDSKKPLLATYDELKILKNKKKIAVLGPLSQCWLGVPLLVNNKAIGAMVVQSYTNKRAYTDIDVVLLELVASNISQSIEHSRNLEQINLLNQALIQSAEAFIVTDTDGVIQYVNPAFH